VSVKWFIRSATLPLGVLTIFFNVPERPCTPSPTCIAFDPVYLSGLPNLQRLVTASNTGQEVNMLNNRLRVPYSDQFSIGMRNRVGDWNTSATVARVLSHNGFVYILGNRQSGGSFFQNGNVPFNFGIPGFGTLILGNNGIETRSTQVLVSIGKPYTEESRKLALYVRLDLLNVFNNTNYADYRTDYGTTGVPPPNPVTFNQIGNILGTPRTLKLQAGVRF
jgi:hypothetical protein